MLLFLLSGLFTGLDAAQRMSSYLGAMDTADSNTCPLYCVFMWEVSKRS